jgi:hypothetical protein
MNGTGRWVVVFSTQSRKGHKAAAKRINFSLAISSNSGGSFYLNQFTSLRLFAPLPLCVEKENFR